MANTDEAETAEQSRRELLHWFEELRDPLCRYLMCRGASRADAEDAAQEAFLKFNRHLDNGGDRTNLSGWVFQVALNHLRDDWKSARRRQTVPLEDAITHRADSRSGPEHGALSKERAERLRSAIEKLPEQQRECMLLRASGLRYREIGEIMGINTGSVGSLAHRAVARLSEDLS
jgi:RNA polymerase sigma-70 factor (ECF subfamily)